MSDQGDTLCLHDKEVHWHLNVQHFGNTNIKYLEVTGSCTGCGAKMEFRGPFGLNPSHPTVQINGTEAIFPFLFSGEKYDGAAVGYSVDFPSVAKESIS